MPQPTAADTAGIGPALRRKRLLAGAIVIATAILGFATALTYAALDEHYLAVQKDLPWYAGTITDVRDTDSEGTAGEVDVRWDQDGTRWKATVHVGNSGEWHDGQSVHVIVDPERPDFTTLPGENYKPDWFDATFVLLGIACVVVIIVGAVWFARTNRKLQRARASTWLTCDAYVVAIEKSASTTFYLPEYSVRHLWKVKGVLPPPKARVQVAGDGRGLVIRRGEDADILLAEATALSGPETVRVDGFDEHDNAVAFRLVGRNAVYYVSGPRDRLPDDVGDLEKLRAATVRLGPSSVALLQLGVSRTPTFLERLTDTSIQNEWPALLDRVDGV